MSIQRWKHDGSVLRVSTVGQWVKYDDHLAALSDVHEWAERIEAARVSGYAAGVQAARDAVAGLYPDRGVEHGVIREALAAIDALRGES